MILATDSIQSSDLSQSEPPQPAHPSPGIAGFLKSPEHLNKSSAQGAIMSTILKGVFDEDRKLYQLWVEPATPVLPTYIRNDYNSSLDNQPIEILAAGSFSIITKAYDAQLELMRVQAIRDGVSATEVPPSPFDI